MYEQDRRSSFRCPVAQEDEAAILRTDRNDVVVRICERSAGGFGVTTEQAVKFKQGAILSLANSSGCFEVQAVHIGAPENGVTRIGLKTIRELKFLRGGPTSNAFTLRQLLTTGSGLLKLATMLVLFAGFFVWGATLTQGDWFNSVSGDGIRSSGRGGYAINPERTEQQLAMQYLRLDGLTKERFVVALNLSPEQQTTIRGILADTTQALSMLYARRDSSQNPEEWSDLGMQTIYTSWKQIEGVLSDKQRAKWDELLSKSNPSESDVTSN